MIFLFSKPINALLLVDENVIATGDDEGTLKLWDMRKSTSFMSLKHHEDYISDITADPMKRTLLTSRYWANGKETHCFKNGIGLHFQSFSKGECKCLLKPSLTLKLSTTFTKYLKALFFFLFLCMLMDANHP